MGIVPCANTMLSCFGAKFQEWVLFDCKMQLASLASLNTHRKGLVQLQSVNVTSWISPGKDFFLLAAVYLLSVASLINFQLW